MRENRIKKAIREDRVAVGIHLLEFSTRGVAKLLEYADLDWVMIDMEHGGFSIDTVANLVAWFKATPITPIVRAPDNYYHLLAPIMDAGALGVMVPKVESAAEARRVVDAVMYPPFGSRGVALTAAHSDFRRVKAKDYFPLANAQTSVIPMIETAEGVRNADAIAAVEGVDVIQPSHHDLSVSLGCPEDYEHPAYKAALKTVSNACRRHGKALKGNPHNDAQIAEYLELGFRVMATRGDATAFSDAVKADADWIRERTGSRLQTRS